MHASSTLDILVRVTKFYDSWSKTNIYKNDQPPVICEKYGVILFMNALYMPRKQN